MLIPNDVKNSILRINIKRYRHCDLYSANDLKTKDKT